MATLLIVDEEPNLLCSLERGLGSDSLRVLTALTAGEGIELVRRERPDVVILGVRLPDMSGQDAFTRIRQTDPHLPVLLLADSVDAETAIEWVKRGAFEYLPKPVHFCRLREVVEQALAAYRVTRLRATCNGVARDPGGADPMIGHSAAMQELYKIIGRVAPQDVTVLILGPSGAGKELVARALHKHSRRADRPFLAINCAAIPEALLESELFGHECGAFTGANHRRIGKFERADRGTILLDEVADMSPATQAKVLRLLQEQRFERVGGSETVQTDMRVLAATNQNLEELVAAGRFRLDLFYRLNGFAIWVPPLRERMDDLVPLIEHFLRRFNQELGTRVRWLTPEALRLLQSHSWPGNVRELQGVLRFALVRAQGEVLTPESLPESLRKKETPPAPSAVPEPGTASLARFIRDLLEGGEPELYRKVSSAVDRILLEEVLRHVRGNQVRASQLLGISRTTLRAKVRDLGLAGDSQGWPEPE